MLYAKIISKGVLVRETPFDGAKPLVNTAPETPDGFRAVSAYVDDGDSIRKVWDYVELTDDEKREIERKKEMYPSAEESLNILLGGDGE